MEKVGPLVVSAALGAFALFLVAPSVVRGDAAQRQVGRYQIVRAGEGGWVVRLDTQSGIVEPCFPSAADTHWRWGCGMTPEERDKLADTAQAERELLAPLYTGEVGRRSRQ